MSEQKEIKLEESCVPIVQSGAYYLRASVDDGLLGQSNLVEERFCIEGPRFALQDTDIMAVYPAEGMKGGFGEQLPHVVFRRKTLPWERSTETESKNGCQEQPWLWVLLLHEEEIVNVQYGKAGEVAAPPEGIFFPVLYMEAEEKEALCGYMDLPRQLFTEILPSAKEMSLLAHARQVNADSVRGDQEEIEQWVSIVAGNRLPGSDSKGRKNRAYLVSMEGYRNWESSIKESETAVRLLVLHSWEFYSVTSQQFFWQVCHGLCGRRLNMFSEEGQKKNSEISRIEENGYVPLTHRMRQGSQTVSFYRGPLSPGQVEQKRMKETNWCPDSLYRYDPEIGIFDVSYAAAWQLGRLLVMENSDVLQEMLRLRRTHRVQVHRQGQQEILRSKEMGVNGQGDKIADWLLGVIRKEGKTLL